MKNIFIYYSFTGNGDVVAQELASKSVDIRKVIRKKKMPKSFFFSILSGGFLASTKHKDKLKDFNPNIKDYEHIIIGSPIWNARLSSPINRVLSELDLSNKCLTFILYSGSGEGPKAVKRIQKEYKNAAIIILKEPKKYLEELHKLKQLSL